MASGSRFSSCYTILNSASANRFRKNKHGGPSEWVRRGSFGCLACLRHLGGGICHRIGQRHKPCLSCFVQWYAARSPCRLSLWCKWTVNSSKLCGPIPHALKYPAQPLRFPSRGVVPLTVGCGCLPEGCENSLRGRGP